MLSFTFHHTILVSTVDWLKSSLLKSIIIATMEHLFHDPSVDVAARIAEIRSSTKHSINPEFKKVRQRMKRHNQLGGYTSFNRNCALMIYMAAGYDTTPAIKFLKHSGSNARPTGEALWPDDALGHLIETWFLEEPMESIAALQQECESGLTHRGRKTTRLLQCNELYQWVKSMNQDHGLAVSTQDMASKYDNLVGTASMDDLVAELSSRSALGQQRNRQFFHRFRKRWVLKLGKISARPVVPPAEMALQASPLWAMIGRASSLHPPRFGTSFGARFCHLFLCQNLAPKLVPKLTPVARGLGPVFRTKNGTQKLVPGC